MSKSSKSTPVTETKRPNLTSLPAQNRAEGSPVHPDARSNDRFAANNDVTHEQIARRAYELWVSRGYRHGQHDHDWLEAERQLRFGRQSS